MIEQIKQVLGREDGSTDDGSTPSASDGGVRGEVQRRFGSPEADPGGATNVVADMEKRDLGFDQIFDILKNQRRRHVLRYLEEADDEVRLGELADQIAAWENDKDVSQITSQERKRVYVGLYQCHLPKMDDMGVVDFNKPRGLIDCGKNIHLFGPYLPPEEPAPDSEQ